METQKTIVEKFGIPPQAYHPNSNTPTWGTITTYQNGDVEKRTYSPNTFLLEQELVESPKTPWEKGEESWLEKDLQVEVANFNLQVFHPDGSELTALISDTMRRSAWEQEECLIWTGKSWIKRSKRK